MNKAKEGLVQQKNQSLWDKQPASKCFVLICCPPKRSDLLLSNSYEIRSLIEAALTQPFFNCTKHNAYFS